MNADLMSEMFGVKRLPDWVPIHLALSILGSGYTEEEVRGIISEENDAYTTELWIGALSEAGYFPSSTSDNISSDLELNDSELDGSPHDVDGGSLLWKLLEKELESNESDFKHRIYVLDTVIKQHPDPKSCLLELCELNAESTISFNVVGDSCPWNGCKFATNTVLLFVSPIDVDSKRDALRPVSRSLGGCTIPPPVTLRATRWPYILMKSYDQARFEAETQGICTALHISVNDVEIRRNPGKKGLYRKSQNRPGTFAHNCVMTVSPTGVYLYQSYGPRGYTLLQHMESETDRYPLSFDDGMTWVNRFQYFTGELGGKWTLEVNQAYEFCFGVDLIKFGNMRLDNQLDVHVDVYTHQFDADLVRKNFSLLPLPDTTNLKEICKDGIQAKSKPVGRYSPDGGVPHYYLPTFLRCGHCGCGASSGDISFKVCTACKLVRYCSKRCQVEDWKLRHKVTCKHFNNSKSA